ncbi:MAG: hypothetical protein DCC67_04300 [Planctomycetota bacterium]|nr:MAG: hypothetical protein DCC67_04300 [Planctomycetota bacterium]
MLALAVAVLPTSGCSLLLPEVAHQPVIRNPFPQLSKVAVAPFFNQSDEATLDGRQVAAAYFAELQATPGFEVVPLGVVEEAIIAHRVDLNGPGEARRLAKLLGVDAVVVGSVTDFHEYYPPRIGLRVEWYTANPGFHEIPAGYGLPWGTPEEEFIPDNLVYESQMSLARAELSTQSPDCLGTCQPLPAPPAEPLEPAAGDGAADPLPAPEPTKDATPASLRVYDNQVRTAQAEAVLPPSAAGDGSADGDASGSAQAESPSASGATGTTGEIAGIGAAGSAWLAQQSSAPGGVAIERPPCIPYNGPVLTHTKIYHGNDAYVTDALRGYVSFRDEHRFGGWKSYLSRTDDYIRFCCHMHISEMLSARGGSRKTRVVWRWPESR